MISIRVGECDVDILPVVNGIDSEVERVTAAYGNYEAYGMAMGIEGIQAIKARIQLESTFEVSELDLVYTQRMMEITGEEVRIPSPAMCAIVDLVAKDGNNVIPLDMNDEDFTEMYCDTVPAYEFVKEHRLAKKGMKKRFKSTTAEEFALEWDSFVNGVKSYGRVSSKREEYIAEQIRDTAKYRKSLLVVIEVERAQGVADLLRREDVV